MEDVVRHNIQVEIQLGRLEREIVMTMNSCLKQENCRGNVSKL